MKMLKFEQKMRGSTNVYVLLQKWESIKMLEFVWVLITKSFKMMYCEWKVWNQSKSWCLVAIKCKMLKF